MTPHSTASGKALTAGDSLSALFPIAAALAVAGLGLLCKLAITDPAMARVQAPDDVVREVDLLLALVFGCGALLAAGVSRLVIFLLNRPTHELAASIALSGMAEVPTRLPASGSAALGTVVQRYNQLVEAVAQTNAQLRAHADRERERAEAVEDFSDLVLAGVPSGIIATDGDGQLVRINDAARDILGIGAEDLQGRKLEDLVGAEHPVARAARAPCERDEVSVIADEEERVLGVSSGSVRAPDGSVLGGVVIFADLTALRHLESQLEMKERLASLGEVAAGLAHEIRNPLGALRGFVELLERRLDDPERSKPMLAKIVREADALSSVVGDFLAFARPAPPLRQPIAVAPLLQEAVEAGSAVLGDQAPQVTVEQLSPELSLNGDAAQLRRALVNFVINAGQATGVEGVVRVGASRDGQRLRLFVQDDGPGVPRELRGKLPTPFLTTKPTGTGLGLAVAHQIAQAHGGELLCESPAEGGARFVIALPWQESGASLS